MLFLVILVIALIRGLIVFGVGCALAILLWLLGLVIGVKIPAFIRWSGAAVLIGILLYVFRLPVTQDDASSADEGMLEFFLRIGSPSDGNQGWDSMQYGTNLICIGIALMVLVMMGLVISVTKGGAKLAVKSAQALADDGSDNESPPPLPPGS